MKFFRKRQRSVADNDTFVTLLRVAQEDTEIRSQLVAILQQPPFHRQSLLNTFVSDMTLQSAPKDFVQAIAALLDEEVAAKALELLKKWNAT